MPGPVPLRVVAAEAGAVRRAGPWLTPRSPAALARGGGTASELLDGVLSLISGRTGGAAWAAAVDGPRDALRYAAELAEAEGLAAEPCPGRRLCVRGGGGAASLRPLAEAPQPGLVVLAGGPADAVDGFVAAVRAGMSAPALASLVEGGGMAAVLRPGSTEVLLAGAARLLPEARAWDGGPEAVPPAAGRPAAVRLRRGRPTGARVAVALLVAALGAVLAVQAIGHRAASPAGSGTSPARTPTTTPAAATERPFVPRLAAGPAPSARARPAQAWDAPRGQLVLFGGSALSPVPTDLGDTWMWSPAAGWAQARPAASPPPRLGAVLTPFAGGLLLYGGASRFPAPQVLSDSWLWDGQNWRRLDVGSPPAAAAVAMATEEPAGTAVLVTVAGASQTTLTLIPGGRWTVRGGAPAHIVAVATDGQGSVDAVTLEPDVLVGRGRTWRFASAGWVPAGASSEPELDALTATMTGLSGGLVLVEAEVLEDGETVGGTWTYEGGAWRRRTAPAPADVRADDAVPPLWGRFDGLPVLVGGGDGSDAFRRVALWDAREWRDLPREGSPPARGR